MSNLDYERMLRGYPVKNQSIHSTSNETYTVFTVCQMNKYGEWLTSTKLDLITVRAPTNYDASITKETENILESIKIVNL